MHSIPGCCLRLWAAAVDGDEVRHKLRRVDVVATAVAEMRKVWDDLRRGSIEPGLSERQRCLWFGQE